MGVSGHKPTFKVSRQRRSLIQRLTPLAWALIVVFAIALVACIAVGVYVATREGPGAFDPTPTNTPAPTEAPTATVEATETVITATVEAGFPAWWADEMTQDEDGNWRLPQEVDDRVWEAFIGGLGCRRLSDMDAVPTVSATDFVSNAIPFLGDNVAVWELACNATGQSPEEVRDVLLRTPELAFLLVDFGPRNPAICNDNPTRCKTAVATLSVGLLSYVPGACDAAALETPCVIRPPIFVGDDPYQLFVATLEYNPGDGQWRIVEMENQILSP